MTSCMGEQLSPGALKAPSIVKGDDDDHDDDDDDEAVCLHGGKDERKGDAKEKRGEMGGSGVLV